MKRDLLLDIRVVQSLDALPVRLRRQLYQRFQEIQSDPVAFADRSERDRTGRQIDVHLFAGFTITYWDDFADRHVKVLRVERIGR